MRVRKVLVQGVTLAALVGCAAACKSASGDSGPTTLADTAVAPDAPSIDPDAVAIVRGAAEQWRKGDGTRCPS